LPKLVIYTAISGRYDALKKPKHIIKNADYVCFGKGLKSKIWNIKPFPNKEVDVVRRARFAKLLPHRLFPDYEISIWLDGSIQIRGDLSELIEQYLKDHNIALCRHGKKRKSLAAEVDACLKKHKDNPKILRRQLKSYVDVDPKIPVCETGMLLRRHLSTDVRDAMEDWWVELTKFSKRDQISFPYIVWKHKLRVKVIEMMVGRNPWTIINKKKPHRKK